MILSKPLNNLAVAISVVSCMAGCGGGSEMVDESQTPGPGQNLVVSTSNYDSYLWHNESAEVTLTLSRPASIGIDFSESVTGISITTADCPTPSNLCELWTITPTDSALPGDYTIPIVQSGDLAIVNELAIKVFPPERSLPIQDVAANFGFGTALLTDGGLLAWGAESALRESADKEGAGFAAAETLPRRVGARRGLPSGPFMQASSSIRALRNIAPGPSSGHALLLHTDGTVWSWGSNDQNQLGRDGADSTWGQVQGLAGVLRVGAGSEHSAALLADGTVWTWGSGAQGQLGNGRSGAQESTVVPTQIASLDSILDIAIGDNHNLALRSDGTVWGWGQNNLGQIGMPMDLIGTTVASPIRIEDVITGPLVNIDEIAAGRENSAATTVDGILWTWGTNVRGAIGIGTIGGTFDYPVRVSLQNVQGIAVGDAHVLALRDDGTLRSWGQNADGQLGLGDSIDSPLPRLVANLGDVRSLGAGESVSFAITNECGGRLWAWGSEYLGNGLDFSSSIPTPVPGVGDLGNCGQDRRLMVYVSDYNGVSGVNISSSLAGLQCTSRRTQTTDRLCWQTIPFDSLVRLTAVPVSPSASPTWHWDCTGNANATDIRMDDHKYCKVTLSGTAASAATLFVDRVGMGTITSDDGGIDCGSDCSESYAVGTTVTLTATPENGWEFVGWAESECLTSVVSVDRDFTCTAQFSEILPGGSVSLLLGFNGGGSGRITDDVGILDCTSECTVTYDPSLHPVIHLTAQPNENSMFASWSRCAEEIDQSPNPPLCRLFMQPDVSRTEIVVDFTLR